MLEAWWAHFSPHPTPSDPDKPHIPNTLKTRVFERIWRPIQCAPVGLHPRRSGGTFGGIFRILRGLISRCPQICPQMTMKRSEEHTSELQSLMRISYAVFCLKKKKKQRYMSKWYTIITPENLKQ